jgi:hypothetical protein
MHNLELALGKEPNSMQLAEVALLELATVEEEEAKLK